MVKMFQEKMAGEGNDPDDLIVQAFKAYDNEGKIDSKMFEHALKTWGDKMTKAEIDDIFGEFKIDSKMFEHALKTWGDKMTKAKIDSKMFEHALKTWGDK